MQKFEVYGNITISIRKTIEANSEEEALEKAEELGLPGLCYQCSYGGENDDETWELCGELDGEPHNFVIAKGD